MKDKKITLERAVKCFKPYRIPADAKRYNESFKFKIKNGFYFEECWNLDAEMAYQILIRLVHFRDIHIGMPGSFCRDGKDGWGASPAEYKRWETQLNKMIRAFYLYLIIDFPNKKEQKIINKGMKLFIEHYSALWD